MDTRNEGEDQTKFRVMDGTLKTMEIIGLNICAGVSTLITISPDWIPPLTVVQTLLTIMVQGAVLSVTVIELHKKVKSIRERRKNKRSKR